MSDIIAWSKTTVIDFHPIRSLLIIVDKICPICLKYLYVIHVINYTSIIY